MGGGGGWPATFEDVAAGIDHLAALAAPLDLARVVTIGHSAGGHLALWAASRDRPGVAVTGAVGQAAVSDLAAVARLGLSSGAVEELLGGSPEQVPDRYAAASPAQRLPLGVPLLLVHGARDDTVPVALSRDFQRRRDRRGRHVRPRGRRARRPLRAHRSRVGRMGYGEAVAGGPLTRAHALELDRADPLAGFRDRFEFGDDDRIYVDGNSLGRLSAIDARRAMEETVNDWSGRLVTGWHDWIDLPQAVGDLLGQTALGAGRGQVLACDSTTVNLYKLAGAVLAVRPGAVVADADDFPTDRYVLEGLAAAGGRELRMLRCDPVDGPQPDAVAAAAEGAALVVLSHVNYRSGALADMPAITRAAQAAGALVLWDLCHSAGAVSVELDAAGADLAVGCTYKYLNAGPGSPAFLYVARRHQDELRSPIQGWFSQADQFAMGPGYRPVAGIGRFMAGTPPVLGLAAVRAGAAMLGEAGIEAVERKAAGLTALAIELHDRRLEPLGLHARDPARPGSARGARLAASSRRLADLPRADRARERRARLPPPRQHPPRPPAAVHALRRRVGRVRPAGRPDGRRHAPADARRGVSGDIARGRPVKTGNLSFAVVPSTGGQSPAAPNLTQEPGHSLRVLSWEASRA